MDVSFDMEDEYPDKYVLKETMNVRELIEMLSLYPKDMKVIITWESTLKSIQKENIYVSKEGHLYLDSDGNFYKEDFAKDPKENE